MEAHLIDTYLIVPRLMSSVKVNVKYQGHVIKNEPSWGGGGGGGGG